jgi:hypothetical protein
MVYAATNHDKRINGKKGAVGAGVLADCCVFLSFMNAGVIKGGIHAFVV